MADYIIRPAVQDDCEEILRLIQELAEFEKLPEQVKMTAEIDHPHKIYQRLKHKYTLCMYVNTILLLYNWTEPRAYKLYALRRDGFGDQKFFTCLVVEAKGNTGEGGQATLWGYALYYFAYSTWEGRVMYLEDLYISPAQRGKGIGTKLFNAVIKIGVDLDCQRMQWVVLSWNQRSIDFYKARGAFDVTSKENWNIFRMDRPVLEQLCKT